MSPVSAWSFSLVLFVTVLAGCLAADDGTAPVDVPETEELPGVTAFVGGGPVPLPAEFAKLRVRVQDTGLGGGEPSLGVTSDGTIFTTAGGANIARSTDDGLSWEVLPAAPQSPKVSMDPWIFIDPWTDRVFNAPLYVVCTWAAWSDDKGDSWDANPIAGCGVPAHDHQKLTAGPPADGVATTDYENVLYYSYNSFRGEGTIVSTSTDGGQSWSLGTNVHPADCHGGVAGPVIVGGDGTAYSPKPACKGFNVAVSTDSGATWQVKGRIDGAGIYEPLATTVDGAVDEAGNFYGVYNGKDGRIYMTRTTDQGETWSEPYVVSPPGVNVTVFSVVTAGEEGRIAIGFLGTEADPTDWARPTAQDAPKGTIWHAYLTQSIDALADEPVFVAEQLTPDDDPAQVGCVWLSGGANDCRNLLDFIDLVQVDGRPYLVYADGCDGCAPEGQSTGSDVFVAIGEEGPSLLGGVLEPLVPASPRLSQP